MLTSDLQHNDEVEIQIPGVEILGKQPMSKNEETPGRLSPPGDFWKTCDQHVDLKYQESAKISRVLSGIQRLSWQAPWLSDAFTALWLLCGRAL